MDNQLWNFRIKKYVWASDIGKGLYAVEDFMEEKNMPTLERFNVLSKKDVVECIEKDDQHKGEW